MPENPAPAQNEFRERLKLWLPQLITPKAYSVAALFGGLVLMRYYSSIHFLPELDVASTLWVLAYVAFVGAVILIVAGGALTLPGILWRINFAPDKDGAPTPDQSRLFLRSFITDLILPLWFVVIVPLTLCVLLQTSSQPRWLQTLCMVGPLLIWPTGTVVYGHLEQKRGKPTSSGTAEQLSAGGPKTTTFLFWQTGVFSWCAWGLSLVFVTGEITATPIESLWEAILMTAVAYIWIAAANLAVVLASRTATSTDKSREISIESAVGVGGCFLVVWLFATPFVPKLIVRGLGIGAIEHATLLLAEDRGKALLTEARRNHCGHPEDPTNGLSDVTILNVLGNRFFLECADKSTTYRFTAPKDIVLSWSTRQPLK